MNVRKFINKMFSALNEKVERLEKENEELKARLSAIDSLEKENEELKSQLRDFSKQIASFESRLVEKTKQNDSKIFEAMLNERLGHHVCVGKNGLGGAVFKNVLDFLNDKAKTTCDRHISFVLTSECVVFNIDCLKFFPIFARTGFDINATRNCFIVNGKFISCETRIHNNKYVGDDNFQLIRKAFIKYGVRLLDNGQPIV
jgi:hypothetical protein